MAGNSFTQKVFKYFKVSNNVQHMTTIIDPHTIIVYVFTHVLFSGVQQRNYLFEQYKNQLENYTELEQSSECIVLIT